MCYNERSFQYYFINLKLFLMKCIIFLKQNEKTQEFFNKMRQPIAAGIHAIVDVVGVLPDDAKTGTPDDRYPY